MNKNNNTCLKTSNNKYFDCPALMSDGRTFTDYRPSNYVNDLIKTTNRVYDSYEYRQFLINNADKIIEENDKYNYSKNSCDKCQYNTINNSTICTYNNKFGLCGTNDCNGLGLTNKSVPLSNLNNLIPLQPGFQSSMPAPFNQVGKNINKN